MTTHPTLGSLDDGLSQSHARTEKRKEDVGHGIPPSNPLSARDLLKFRQDLELGYGLFQEITGLDLTELNRYRRQRGSDKPNVTPEAAQRITRCRQALQFALEITAGDHDKAVDWLYAPSPIFEGKSPIDLAAKKAGFAKIESVITQMRALTTAGVATKKEEPPKSHSEPSSVVVPRENPAPVPAVLKLVPSLPTTVSSTYTPRGLARAKPSAPIVIPKASEFAIQVPVSPAAPPVTEPQEKPPTPAASVITQASTPNETANIQVPRDRHVLRNPERVTIEASHVVRETRKKIVVHPVQEEFAAGAESFPVFQGVDPDARLFRLKPRLQPLLEKNKMSVKALGDKLLAQGFTQFKTQTLASRIANSYTWATWREVVAIAGLFKVNPYELADRPER